MTPSEYIKWLNKEIEVCDRVIKKRDDIAERSYLNGRKSALYEVKNQFGIFIATKEPSQTTEKRKAAIQNGFDDYCEAHDLPYRNECPLCPPLTDSLPEQENNFTDGL